MGRDERMGGSVGKSEAKKTRLGRLRFARIVPNETIFFSHCLFFPRSALPLVA
jgi:hypothetical protein